MRIGIIGTGAIGGTLASKFAANGHEVKVNNTGNPQELKQKAEELGASPATKSEVVTDVDVIILSIPMKAIPELPDDLFEDVPEDVIIIDTTNYYPARDGKIEELDRGKPESLWVSDQIGRPVIKVFNNLVAHTLKHKGKAAGEKDRIAIAISGDGEHDKEIVAGFVDEVGFDTVDAGPLSESWRQQPGTPAYCTELTTEELKQALADADKEKAPKIRDQQMKKFQELDSRPTHEEVIALNRSLFDPNPKKAL